MEIFSVHRVIQRHILMFALLGGSGFNWNKDSPKIFASSLEDSFFYFTTFKDPRSWGDIYQTCRPLSEGRNVGTLTPIIIRDVNKTKTDIPGIQVYNNKPVFGYRMSFHFPRRPNRCFENPKVDLETKHGNTAFEIKQLKKIDATPGVLDTSCMIMERTGLIRAVVLSADRKTAENSDIKEHEAEKLEPFITIITEEGEHAEKREKRFTEAVFLGSRDGSTRYRSSHIIEGKSYPMEIYMYFENPSFPAVEESPHDNPEVKQLVSAKKELTGKEKVFFQKIIGLKIREDYFRRHAFKHTNFENITEESDIPLLPKEHKDGLTETFHKVGSEQEREKIYYDAEYAYQRAKWAVNTGELLTDSLEHINGDQGLGYFDKVLLEKKYNNEVFKIIEAGNKECSHSDVKEKIKRYEKQTNSFNQNWELDKPNKTFTTLRERKELNKIIDQFVKCVKKKIPDFSSKALFKTLRTLDEIKAQYDKIKNVRDTKANITKYFFDEFKYSKDKKYIDDTGDYKHFVDDLLVTNFVTQNIKKRIHMARIQNEIRTEGRFFTDELIVQLKKNKTVSVKLPHRFQISWLLPPTGGYYRYAGSTPFPPCITVPNTLVFEHSIKMSKRQISELTTIPELDPVLSKLAKPVLHDITNTLPPIFDQDQKSDLKITYNDKAPQFRRDDEHHHVIVQSKAPTSGSKCSFVLAFTVLSLIMCF